MAIASKELFDAVMAAPELVSPQEAIIARQAIEIEELRRAYNDLVNQSEKLNTLLSQAKQLHSRFLRY